MSLQSIVPRIQEVLNEKHSVGHNYIQLLSLTQSEESLDNWYQGFHSQQEASKKNPNLK